MSTKWTQADVDALEAEIATHGSIQAHTFSDQSATFYPLSDRLALLAKMKQAVAAAAGGTPGNIRYAVIDKGF
jgi:hypothetical protein